MKPTYHNTYRCLSLQLPNQITIADRGHYDCIPVEVVGWFLSQLQLADGDWVLVTTPDARATLPSQLIMRWVPNINVTAGISRFTGGQVCTHVVRPCC